MRRRTFFILFLLLTGIRPAFSQITAPVDTALNARYPKYRIVRDSAYFARQKELMDSLGTHAFFNLSRRSATSPIVDSLLKANAHPELNLFNISKVFSQTSAAKSLLKQGTYLPKGEIWGLAFIACFLVLFSFLRFSFSRQLLTIVQSFFSNRILSNLTKEDNLFTSWPFLLLFILFGFVVGMFYYLVTQYYQLAGGFKYFITISTLIVALYALKIFVLKALGHFFNLKKPVHEYITVLYSSYFNAGLLFMPLVVAFALSPLKFGIYFIITSYIILGIILGLQFIRAGINILSNYRFSKLYLLLYFCALEICPIVILIKAIRY